VSQPHFEKVWGHHSYSRKWELGVLRDFRKLRTRLHGQNTLHWGALYTIEKVLKCRCQNGLTWAIWTYIAQVMVERRARRLVVWLPTTKSQELTRFRNVQRKCDTSLKSSWGKLKVWFRPRPNQRSSKKLWSPKVLGIQIGTISGLHFGSPGKKCHSDVCVAERRREYYMEGRWWLPPSPGCGESSECRVTRGSSQHRKCPRYELTLLWLVCGCRTIWLNSLSLFLV
jgi:hypothetical protein